MIAKLVLLATLPLFTAATECSCSGFTTPEGGGQCRTAFKGRHFCYVEDGGCSDQMRSSLYNQYWSYKACESSFPECFSVGGDPCIFPFQWEEQMFHNCTTYKSVNGAAWCATKVAGEDRQRVWGALDDCASPCDHQDTVQQLGSSEKCRTRRWTRSRGTL